MGHWKLLVYFTNQYIFFSRAILGVEAWAAIGLIGGIVILIIGLIWIVFCIMLYRHHKERQGDDQDRSNVSWFPVQTEISYNIATS